MTEENTPKEGAEGFLGGLLGKAKEFGEKAKDVAGDAFEAVKDFAEDLPENAQKLAADASAAAKDFAEDLPENAQKLAAGAQKLAGEAVDKAKDLIDGDAPAAEPPAQAPAETPAEPPAPTA